MFVRVFIFISNKGILYSKTGDKTEILVPERKEIIMLHLLYDKFAKSKKHENELNFSLLLDLHTSTYSTLSFVVFFPTIVRLFIHNGKQTILLN